MQTLNINLVRQQTARLLARENITVRQDPKAPTAYFALKDRELVLPVWGNMSNELYDMLVGHEVGHALYTPHGNGGWKDSAEAIAAQHGVAHVPEAVAAACSFLNIVEDARIERLIQGRYPGLRRDFTIAYRELHGRDIFGLAKIGGDLSKLGLPDRLNLHFKVGLHLTVPFSAAEQSFVQRMTDAVTWEEVVGIAADLYKWEVQNGNSTAVASTAPGTGEGQEGEEGEEGEDGEPIKVKKVTVKRGSKPAKGKGQRVEAEEIEYIDGDEDGDADGEGEGDAEGEEGTEGEGEEGEGTEDSNGEVSQPQGGKNAKTAKSGKSGTEVVPTVAKTADALDNAQRHLVDKTATGRNYVAVPTVRDLRDWIVPNSTFVAHGRKTESDKGNSYTFGTLDTKWNGISQGSRDTVTEFVQEFERRKAADEHRRLIESKTGRIDTNSLWRSTLTDDVFRTSTIIRDGKNHGFVVFIDWSSSMRSNMLHTLKQLYILGSFCRKVGVPFEAYAFGAGQSYKVADEMSKQRKGWLKQQPNAKNEVKLNDSLVHILSGGSSARDWRDSFRYCLAAAQALGEFGLGGYTPLGQAVALARPVVEAFKAATKVQIVNTVFLTDGDANDEALKGHSSSGYGSIHVLRDGSREWSNGTNNPNDISVLVNWLRDVTGSRVLGIFVGQFDYATNYMKAADNNLTKSRDEYNKNGWCAVRALGFDQFFVLSGAARQATTLNDAFDTTTSVEAATLEWLRKRNAHRGMVTSLARSVAAAV